MYRVRSNKPQTPASVTLGETAASRKSHWLSNVLAWLGAASGTLAVLSLVSGINQAALLPTMPRPGVGPGFSESATAGIGAMLFGVGFSLISLISLVLVGLALLHARNRWRTLAFLLPAGVSVCLLIFIESWAE